MSNADYVIWCLSKRRSGEICDDANERGITYLALSRRDRVPREPASNHGAMGWCAVRGSEPSAPDPSGSPAASPCALPLS